MGSTSNFEYEAACGQIRNDHALALAFEPQSPIACEPQPVPPVPHSSLYEPIDFAAADLLFEPLCQQSPGRLVGGW